MIVSKAKKYWTRFWMHFAGCGFWGRLATRLASWFVPGYLGRLQLVRFNKKGYISPNATIEHSNLVFGNHVFIGDRVVIYNPGDGGRVDLGDGVRINGDTIIQTDQGGGVKIGEDTHIQQGCSLLAYKASIEIGRGVQIAQRCAFYNYDHGILPGELISKQPLTTKGDIKIGDDVWLGFGVIVLSGVRIGEGAVVGAGSVVTHSIPDGAIAVGTPARVIKMRSDIEVSGLKKIFSR
jgi:acetyltransferase-like isoleucine patch superfamily enzyme